METRAKIKNLALRAVWAVLPKVAKGALYRRHRAHRCLIGPAA